MSILSEKKIAVANKSYVSMPRMPKTPLENYLIERFEGEHRDTTASQVAAKGGMATSTVSEYKSGKKQGIKMGLDMLVKLAKGLEIPPTELLRIILGQQQNRLSDEAVSEMFEDFCRLTDKEREPFSFTMQSLKEGLTRAKRTKRQRPDSGGKR